MAFISDLDSLANYYPPTGFKFLVRFLEIGEIPVIDSFFQEVTGLRANVETESYRQADRTYDQFLPTKVTFETLKLKRGYTRNSALSLWVRNAIENFDFLPATVHIQLLDRNNGPLASWTVSDAIPVHWGITEFNAESSNLVIESLELKYEFFRQNKT